MQNFNRRKLLKTLVQGTAGISLLPLLQTMTGCGHGDGDGSNSSLADEATVTLQDIRMEGWSTLGSGFLGNNGVLKATQIRDNVEITLPYVQDSHGHSFVLTPADFQSLREGREVRVLTSEALNHRHEVRINPTKVVPGSTPLTMALNPNTSNNGDLQPELLEVYVALSEGDDPKIYATSEPGKPLEFCLGPTATSCSGDEGNWNPMVNFESRGPVQILATPGRVSMGFAAEPVLGIRSSKGRDRPRHFVLKKR